MNGPTPELLDKRLLFFTGKGGVGKSTMAAATALLASSIGKRVLLVEVDAKGDIPAQFERAPVGFTPKEIHPGILAMAMDTEASLQEYLRLNLRVPVIGRIGPLARVLDFVATAAPGVKEILTIGKILWEVREAIEGRADFDLVVVDAAATGHIVAQLGAPDAIRELVDVGPLRSQTEWLSELLADPAIRPSTSSRRPRRCRLRKRSTSSPAFAAKSTCRSAASSSTGCCPSCSPGPTRRRSKHFTRPQPRAVSTRESGRAPPTFWTRRAWRSRSDAAAPRTWNTCRNRLTSR